MQTGTAFTLAGKYSEPPRRLQPSHTGLERYGSHQAPERHTGGLMVFDHRGRLVMADASAELTMAALGVELNRDRRLRIDALDTSPTKPSVGWQLPAWLNPEWIEPVIEGSERLGTVIQIPTGRSTTAHKQGGLPSYKLRQIVGFIEAHIDEPITLQQLAELVSLSPFHFHREFKRSTGLTPGKFIFDVRIKHARTLLGESELPLAQVAVQVGFADQSHFTAAFRKATAMTPRMYRKAHAMITHQNQRPVRPEKLAA